MTIEPNFCLSGLADSVSVSFSASFAARRPASRSRTAEQTRQRYDAVHGFTIALLHVAITLSALHVGATEGRLWLHAKINGRSAKLAFDSGCNSLVLSPGGLKRLGVKFIPGPTNDFPQEVWAGMTEEVSLTLEGTEGKTRFMVLNQKAYEASDFDGVVGWAILRENIWKIDAAAGKVTLLEELPKQTVQWERLHLDTNCGTLDLSIPISGGSNGVLCIDTGSDGGVALPAKKWREWKETHHNQPLTLETKSTPSDGFYVHERSWADEVALGPVFLRGVPVEPSGPAAPTYWGSQYIGTLELAALKRLDLVVDGPKGLAYFHAKKDRPLPFQHNRLGAVFVPIVEHSAQAVAQVIESSPAYAAGIRDNDILLEVDGISVTSWNSRWLSRFCLAPGTKLKLRLKRNGETFTTTAVLRDIVGPSTASHK